MQTTSFFRCHLYRNHRQELMDTVSQHGNITLNIILNGDLHLSNESNIVIFEAVERYIQRTKTFEAKVNRLHSYQLLFVPDKMDFYRVAVIRSIQR